jgi:uncharacterized protein YecE (DUF72 family)
MSAASGKIRIGIGGWSYEPWRGIFYPEKLPAKRELDYASRRLTSIEINATYYRAQKPETFAKWRDETPDDFVFSLKAPRFATNRRALAEAGASIDRFFGSGVTELGRKLGPINWQFMPTKKFDPVDFEAFLTLLPQSIGGVALRHVVEPRHDSFRTPEFVSLARKFGAAIVVAGDSAYPQIADPTASFVYARIMGSSESEELGYSDADLDIWAERAKIWSEGGAPEGLDYVGAAPPAEPRDVFLYVISGHKARNPLAAQALIQRTR